MRRCNCSKREAKEALQQAGRDGRVDATGLIPLSAHPNAKLREAHPARRIESLRPADWGGQIDWDAGKVGPYFSVSIKRINIEAWLNAGREAPSTSVGSEDALRKAPNGTIRAAITAAYDEAERAGQKAPNVREVVKPVQAKLRDQGFEASGSQIQALADAEEYKKRRRKVGVTLASERRRQD
jgi:hypothetical protein